MALLVELRQGDGITFGGNDKLIFIKTHWNNLIGQPSTYNPAPHTHDAGDITGVLADARIPSLGISKITNLQTMLDGKLIYDDVLMPTNPFGGRKLYINSVDNAMYAADKKWVVTATRHLVSYGGETYPKLNPDYLSQYVVTGSGTTRQISSTPYPSHIVVYENDTLKYVTTHYTYNASTGLITFTYTPSGTIYVYPGQEVPQYLDSPVDLTYTAGQVANLFDGSYETTIGIANGYYAKVRITPDPSNYGDFGGYKYGNLYLSYYYTGTPTKAEYRVYNYSYRPHTVGWKKYDMTDFIGTNTGAGYIQQYNDQGNHGRSVMEFIVYGHDTSGGAYTTSLSQIDWKLSRPNLSSSGATVTKYGVNKLYYDLKFGDRSTDKVVIGANGTIKINNLDIYHPGNPSSLFSIYRGYISNFDNAITPGIYYFDNLTTNKPNVSAWGWVHIDVNDNVNYNGSSNWLRQHIQQTDGKEYYRYKINANSWTSWYQVYSSQYKPSMADLGGRTATEITTEISNAISNLIASSPDALNTLNELAAALGDDPNFASTVNNAIAARVIKNADITPGTKPKITYDQKGLVTGGADLVEADIPPLSPSKIQTNSTNRFVTDTEKATWDGKQNDLGFTPVPNSRKVANIDLVDDITVTELKTQLGIGAGSGYYSKNLIATLTNGQTINLSTLQGYDEIKIEMNGLELTSNASGDIVIDSKTFNPADFVRSVYTTGGCSIPGYETQASCQLAGGTWTTPTSTYRYPKYMLSDGYFKVNSTTAAIFVKPSLAYINYKLKIYGIYY